VSNRSAHATIKGYFYQFDNTIVRILEASNGHASVVVEGIEDIDLEESDESTFIQCKYYEGTEYNHSVIKDAVIQMLKHYNDQGFPPEPNFKYHIFGHYRSGQEKLPETYDLDFLKKNFLTYTHNKKKHEVHVDLKVDDTKLAVFKNNLKIDINAPTYEAQQIQVLKLLVAQISECTTTDAQIFYYPNSINVIQTLAVESDIAKRKITKASFISKVNQKESVFNLWLNEKFGNDYYAKLIKRKYFKYPSTKIPKASRVFVVDNSGNFDLSNTVKLLIEIGSYFSHKEHKRTPQQDRFCPYVLLLGITDSDLISVKKSLLGQGIIFNDGYPFLGSEFSPEHLAAPPTKENLISIKFIPSLDQIAPVITALKGTTIELFDFFKNSPVDEKYIPKGISHDKIQIKSANFINEVLKI
jgi:hypothetical protein